MKEQRNKYDNKLGEQLETLSAKAAMAPNSAVLEPEAEMQRLRLRLNNDIVGGRTSRVHILLAQHPWLANAKLDFGGERHGYIQRGYTPLHLSAAVGRIKILQFLLEAGADATLTNDDGHLPLYYAVTAPVRPYHARAMGYLLLLAMEERIEDEHQREIWLAQTLVALASAGEVGRQGLITLWSMNVDLDSRDATGTTAVHTAAEYDDLETLELLVELDADMNPRDDDGDTPLHRAVRSSSRPTVERLLRSGGNFRLANHAGKTPYDIAKSTSAFNLIELFKNRDDQDDSRVLVPVESAGIALNSIGDEIEGDEIEDEAETAALDHLIEERSLTNWVEAQQRETSEMFNSQPNGINEWVWDAEADC